MKVARKECGGCQRHLPLTEFHRDSKRPDGRRSRCKLCVNERNRVWYADRGGWVSRPLKRWCRCCVRGVDACRILLEYNDGFDPFDIARHHGLTVAQVEDILDAMIGKTRVVRGDGDGRGKPNQEYDSGGPDMRDSITTHGTKVACRNRSDAT